MQYETVHTEEVEGYTIELAIAPEEDSPRDHFYTDEGDIDRLTCDAINSGDLMWFMARVTASLDGVVLGTDHLACCCYETISDFLRCGYYRDMVGQAITEAELTLARLNARAVGE
jgi:hypothetical protein